MFLKKFLFDIKQDLENKFSDEQKSEEKVDELLEQRRYQISVIL